MYLARSTDVQTYTRKGVTIPEVFYLLEVIYNEAMHLREHQDNFSGLGSKLSNLTIKHMIETLSEAAAD